MYMRGDTRGQSGLDRLLLFVVFLVAVTAVAPFALEFGGVDVRQTTDAEETPVPTVTPEDDGVIVLGATGETGGFGDDTVGVVHVVVTKNGSGSAIDTSTMTASWVGPGSSSSLTAATSETNGAGDGTFDVNVTGPSDSETLLNASGDRATLTFDLGADDVEGVSEFGSRLESGDRVTLELTTDSGATTRTTFAVPGELGGKSNVRLRSDS